MSSKTPRAAFEAFLAPIQAAITLVGPAGRGVLTSDPKPLRINQDHWLLFPEGLPVRLADNRLFFDLVHGFRIVEDPTGIARFRVTTTRYFYGVLDEGHRELLAYHYHPEGAGWCTYPHLHVGTARGTIDNKAHLATGRVSREAVIRMLIEDPEIPVVALRPDWARVLEASQRAFERARTWG